jgi:hypothetical protein
MKLRTILSIMDSRARLYRQPVSIMPYMAHTTFAILTLYRMFFLYRQGVQRRHSVSRWDTQSGTSCLDHSHSSICRATRRSCGTYAYEINLANASSVGTHDSSRFCLANTKAAKTACSSWANTARRLVLFAGPHCSALETGRYWLL